ncbi:MAG: amidohydrolase family protein [Proteobacteria bacterium]|nr:amidohydrolase family protein [Pseudomonadota bacterium]
MSTPMRAVLVVVVLLAIAVLVVWRSLTPVPPLALPESGAVLSGVTMVNPGLDRRDGVEIRVVGSRIHTIASASVGESGPYAGAYVLPGLVDMHVHFPPDSPLRQAELFAFLFLYHGITTVRDAGDVDGTATGPAREGVESGAFPGPRIFACGPFIDGEDPLWPNSEIIRGPGDARRAVEALAEGGFDCVKVYGRLSASGLEAVRGEAQKHGLPLIGHVPFSVSYEKARLDDVQHMTRMPVSPIDDERGFPALMVDWRNLDEERTEFLVQTTLEFGIANTPTLIVTEQFAAMADYEALRASPDAQLLPRLYRDVVWSPVEGLPSLRTLGEEDFAALRDARAPRMALIKRLHRAGARIHVGSDVQNPFVIPGASLHRELALLVEAGLTPEEAWQAATRVSGGFLAPGLGRIVEAAPADLLVFREDPTRDLAALDTLEAVIAQGRLYSREALDAQLARYRAQFENPIYDAVSVFVARRLMARIVDGDR